MGRVRFGREVVLRDLPKNRSTLSPNSDFLIIFSKGGTKVWISRLVRRTGNERFQGSWAKDTTRCVVAGRLRISSTENSSKLPHPTPLFPLDNYFPSPGFSESSRFFDKVFPPGAESRKPHFPYVRKTNVWLNGRCSDPTLIGSIDSGRNFVFIRTSW